MSKLDVFIKQVEFAGKEKLSKEIAEVTANRADKSWKLNFIFDDFLLPNEVEDFLQKVEAFLHIGEINHFEVTIQYKSNDYTNLDMVNYYHFILDDLVREKGRFMVLKGLDVNFMNNTYYIDVPRGSANFSLYSRELEKHFQKYGFTISCVAKENIELASIDEVIDQKKNETSVNYVVNKAPARKPEIVTRKKKATSIKAKTEPISSIPSDRLGLNDYESTIGPLDFVVEGEVFFADSRKTTKSMLFYFKITDETDSILVKIFANSAKEIEGLNEIKVGSYIKAAGKAEFDNFEKDVILKAAEIALADKPYRNERKDDAEEKRVELHAHTIMSNMDAVATPEQYIKTIEKWGHKAIAFTDHDGVYSYPDIAHAVENKDIKPIYGVEVNLVNKDEFRVAFNEKDIDLEDATFVVFDIETTGLSTEYDDIIEVGAWKYHAGTHVEEFQRFIKVNRKLTSKIQELTNITNEMLEGGQDEKIVIKDFYDFASGSILVAHNANFDIGHMYNKFNKNGIEFEEFPVIDTMQVASCLHFDDMKNFKLDTLTKYYKIKLENHHRASDDALATGEVFMMMLSELKKKGINNYKDLNSIIPADTWKMLYGSHTTLLAKNQVGYKNIFKIVSDSLTEHLYKKPRVLKEFLESHREGILVGSSCVNGDIFETALNKPYKDLLRKMDFYDYIEVQPPSVYAHLKINASVDGDFLVENTIKKIIKAAKEKGKIVVATGDVHYIEPEDQKYRDIYLRTPVVGGGKHSLSRFLGVTKQHLRTTKEMLDEFNFLDNILAYNIVIENTNIIANMIEPIRVFPKGLFAPSDDEFKDSLNVPSIEEALKEMVNTNVHKMYGEQLPRIVEERLNKELNSIITHKFSSVYFMSHLLVKKSLDDGYLVGSRGSVGSSFVATLMNITEVNPLSPHYRCPRCTFASFKMNEEEKEKCGIRNIEVPLQEYLNAVDDGYDLPDATCPICGTPLKKDGHDIPFETFLGFKGDKTPDIDLNFSGEYQSVAHEYIRSVMGYDNAFRAGTLSTVAEKTAYGYVKGYLEDNKKIMRKAEIERIAKRIEGVKRSSGQHPGGIVVVPSSAEIYDVTPIQYPADDKENSFRTTHFDYHSFESNLLKLDILGHDDPTMIKYLMDYVKKHPNDFPFGRAQDIPVDDRNVYRLFSETEVIGVKKEDIKSEVASFAIPELGTDFVRQMLVDTKPKTFAELLKISGLSHGTDVWLNNAKSLVSGEKDEYGKIDFKKIIGCRDDIMVDLMYQGLEPAKAFEIMEFVRKGKPCKNKEKWAEHIEYMRKYSVPEWYIWSCGQIKYMFPKAHATAYILMALRIAWFKVYKPLLFYAGVFSKRMDCFDIEVMCGGVKTISARLDELLDGKYDTDETSKQKAEGLITTLSVALEMVNRGFVFKMADITRSLASEFVMLEEEEALLFPFTAIDGLGKSVADNIVSEREEKAFTSKQNLQARTKINKTVFDRMEKFGVLNSLEDADDNDDNTLFAFID